MHSCLYNGWIRHRRHTPHVHEFRYRLFMMYLDLDELPKLFERYWCWSTTRPALARFERADYHGDPSQPLRESIRATVRSKTGCDASGPIRMLAHLRYFGHVFNPVSFYYCFDARDTRVETIVAEITNTPWKERHTYVLPVSDNDARIMQFAFDKEFHVSPFMPLDLQYDWRFSAPADSLVVHMSSLGRAGRAFDATLSLSREAISSRSLAMALLRFPAMTATVVGAIYWQALRLWLKRTPCFAHPGKAATFDSTTPPTWKHP